MDRNPTTAAADVPATDARWAPVDIHHSSIITHHLARWLRRRHPVGGEALERVMTALLAAEAEGHTCLTLSAEDQAMVLACGAAVRAGADTVAELTLDGGDLYLTRLHRAECALARALATRLAQPRQAIGPGAAALLPRLFATAPERPDRQAVACLAALGTTFQVITGGPGTGKTTTTAKLLALLLADRPDLRIALTAPTGKAAQRLAEAIGSALGDVPGNVRSPVATSGDLRPQTPDPRPQTQFHATTLHRLLAWHGADNRFHHHAGNPLPHDVVVVDEAGMVDLALFSALVTALRPTAQLIVLGDPGQLASVDTGTVLADLCRAADNASAIGHSPALAAVVHDHLGQELAEDSALSGTAAALRDAVVELRFSHRFGLHTPIGALAAAVRAGTPLTPGISGTATDHGDEAVITPDLAKALGGILPAYRGVLAARSPAEALERLGRARLLCAERHGPRGVEGLNRAIEQRLGLSLVSHGGHHAYHGQPLLITRNDPETGLANGDVGVCWREAGIDGDQLAVWFPGGDGNHSSPNGQSGDEGGDGSSGLRRFALARLPEHVTAWAMTIHKSQGSEFDQVVVVLPATPSPLVCRQLLYTGITRARRTVQVVADDAVFRHAVRTAAHRHSGLGRRLSLPVPPASAG